VLKVAEHGESDKLITLYSLELGRVTGIAKGARKSQKRFVNKLEEFSLLRFFYRPPRGTAGLYFISEAELLCANLPLRLDYRRYAVAIHFCELLLRFTRENDPDSRLYRLLHWTLAALCVDKAPFNILVLAHLHLLCATGYRPVLDRCGACGQPITSRCRYILIPMNGSLVCTACDPLPSDPRPKLSIQTLRVLLTAQSSSLERLSRIQLSRTTALEALEALHTYTLHLLQQDIHSWQVVRALGPFTIKKTVPPRIHFYRRG
jgi:DNA repair protein RecO (recombination protein O)